MGGQGPQSFWPGTWYCNLNAVSGSLKEGGACHDIITETSVLVTILGGCGGSGCLGVMNQVLIRESKEHDTTKEQSKLMESLVKVGRTYTQGKTKTLREVDEMKRRRVLLPIDDI